MVRQQNSRGTALSVHALPNTQTLPLRHRENVLVGEVGGARGSAMCSGADEAVADMRAPTYPPGRNDDLLPGPCTNTGTAQCQRP